MSKWNLFEIFSHLDMTHEDLPEIRKTARFSHRAVRSRVMDALDAETEGAPARRHWKLRVPVVITAAAVLVSGSAITAAAAANGGFAQLMQVIFGKDVSYPSALEELYTVPEVEMTNTCDGIDCRVLGVFGDEHNVNVVLEFSGVNGFTLPEDVRFFGESPKLMGDGVYGYSGELNYTYDASDGGHLYVTDRYEFDQLDLEKGAEYSMEIQSFLHTEESAYSYFTWDWASVYDMWDIRNWLGYSMADINTKKALSETDWQKVSDNFDLVDDMNAYQRDSFCGGKPQNDDERVYLRKSEILTDGSISLKFNLDSLKTKVVTDDFVFTDAETGEDTPMTMELSPWGASFTWKTTAPMPRVFGYVTLASEHDVLNGSCSGYVRTPDGLTKQAENVPEQLNHLFYNVGHVPYVYVDQVYTEGHVTLYMSFLEPVDPDQVQEVYAGDGTLMWKK